MAHKDQETISIGDYLLERLSQIGVQARPYTPYLCCFEFLSYS
jgi:hypothetical protein